MFYVRIEHLVESLIVKEPLSKNYGFEVSYKYREFCCERLSTNISFCMYKCGILDLCCNNCFIIRLMTLWSTVMSSVWP